tara:strand:+ start:561 stop:770 length:210 start_codon:yes stop_codon:yes gene_type:complete
MDYRRHGSFDRHFRQLVGCKVTGFQMQDDGDDMWPTLMMRTDDGEGIAVVLSRDPEGNGPGFAFIEPVE